MAQRISKISVKTVVGRVNVEEGQTAELMMLGGVAKAVKTGESTYGPWTALIGDFKAINMATGEEFRAGKCFPPELVIDPLVAEIEAGKEVSFLFTVCAKHDPDAQAGYTYTIKEVAEPTENDPVEKLFADANAQAALPAPAKKTAAKKAPAKKDSDK